MIKLTSHERDVLRRWGKDPNLIATQCHQRPDWLRELLAEDARMKANWGAKLWDFSDKIVTNAENGVAFQQLTASDRDKADRIEDVLLGNGRRF